MNNEKPALPLVQYQRQRCFLCLSRMLADINYHPFARFVLFHLPKRRDTPASANTFAVAVGDYHVVGLKSDGTVVASGDNGYGQCDVSEWKDVVAIWSDNIVTIGLTEDGKILKAGRFMGDKYEADTWPGIKTGK